MTDKQPSTAFRIALKDTAQSIGKSMTEYINLLKIGESEGFSKEETDMLLKPYLLQIGGNEQKIYRLLHYKEPTTPKPLVQNNVIEDITDMSDIVQKNDTELDYIPKVKEIPTETEQSYIDSLSTANQIIMSTVKKDWNKVIEILRSEGFTFNSDPQIWKDTGIELSKEFSKEEYATKTYRVLIEEVFT